MTVIGIILIVAAIFLVVAVLMQHGKSHNLSGTIAGASETFFGKSKSTTLDRKLQVVTTVVAIVFVVLVLVAYLAQDITVGGSSADTTAEDTAAVDTTEDTTVDTAEDTAADTAEETSSDTAEEDTAENTEDTAEESESESVAE